jgi:hypothetical protein
MHNGAADEQTNHDEYRQENDHCGSNSQASHRGKAAIVAIREQAEGLKTEREQKRHNPSYASADQCIDERFAQTAFAFHYAECFCRPDKHHRQRLDERVKKATALAMLPRKAGARRSRCCHGSSPALDRRDSSRSSPSELWKLREWLPISHAFAPADIGWRKTAGTQAFANFVFRENAQTRCAPVNMNHCHDAPFY